MQSREGAIFFVINIVGNFGTVFLDSKCLASPVDILVVSPRDITAEIITMSVFIRLTPFRRLLQQSHRRVSSPRLSRLYPGWSVLVCDPLAHGDNYGPFSPCPRIGK